MFTSILCDPVREISEVAVKIPALQRPTLNELQAKYPWVHSIERDTSPEDPLIMVLGTVFRENEGARMGGAEYECRLHARENLLLGFQHRYWLLEHQAEFPALMPLRGKITIDFPGIVVASPNGYRTIPYADQCGRRWEDRWRWFDDDVNGHV